MIKGLKKGWTSVATALCYDLAGLLEKGQVSRLLSYFTLSPDDAFVQGWGCGVKLVDSGLQGLAKESYYLVYPFILKRESSKIQVITKYES